MNSVSQKAREWDAKHGGDPVLIDGWLLFPDGASREQNPIGCWVEPPEDKYKKARMQLKYCQIKLNLATENFHLLKHNIKVLAKANLRQHWCPAAPVGCEQTEELKRLQKIVRQWQQRVNRAEQNLHANKPARLAAREQEDQHNRQRNELLLNELEDIEV